MKALICSLLNLWLAFEAAVGHSETSPTATPAIAPVVAPPREALFSRAELDQMLAPIALYPDTVLSHILIAATYPLEVVQADRWAQANSHLTGEDAVEAVALEDWDPSVKALVAFPDILRRMSNDLDWTQRLGDAFLADETRMMDAIQNLREKAYASNNLRDTQYTRVVREEKVIVIEPAIERVVYIPYYDTRVVYGPWWWADCPPVYWHHPVNYVHIGGFYWGPRTYLSTSFFFSSPHWHQRHVVVIDYHNHHHPRYYSGHKIAHYQGAHHWQHNPEHRHNVAYRHDHVRHKFEGHKHHSDGGRFERDWRPDQDHNSHNSQHRGPDRHEQQAHNNNDRQNNDRQRGDRDRPQSHGQNPARDQARERDQNQWRNRDNREPVTVARRSDPEQRDNRRANAGEQNHDQSRREGAHRADQVRERLGQGNRERNGQQSQQRDQENRTAWRNNDNDNNNQRGQDDQVRNANRQRNNAEGQQQERNPQHSQQNQWRSERREAAPQEQRVAQQPRRQENQSQEENRQQESRRESGQRDGGAISRKFESHRTQPQPRQGPRNEQGQRGGRFER